MKAARFFWQAWSTPPSPTTLRSSRQAHAWAWGRQTRSFPTQPRISVHSAGWRESEIDRWITDPVG
ncbi:MAG: AlpA family phage regulatory protein [Pseudomonadota bacterium]